MRRIELWFENLQEAHAFSDFVCERDSSLKVRYEKAFDDTGYHLLIDLSPRPAENLKELLVRGIVHVMESYYFDNWYKTILKENYYFTNEQEIEQILPFIRSVVKEPKQYVPEKFQHRQSCDLYSFVQSGLYSGRSFHFNLFLKKAKQDYYEWLIELIGYAIDEWKRESEYQEFIHHLRNEVNRKNIKCDALIIYSDHSFQYYNSDGVPYTRREIKQLQNKEPLYLYGQQTTDPNLSPLLALNPRCIQIYTHKPEDPLVQKVVSVFQERVEILPAEKFPYTS